MQVRPLPEQIEPLKALAKVNRRSMTAEVQEAIDSHIRANREYLAPGPKLSNTTTRKSK